MRTKYKIATVALSILGMMSLTQNCGVVSKGQHEYPSSPFEENKLILSASFAEEHKLTGSDGQELNGAAIIAAGTELSVIVRDQCIHDRLAANGNVKYWIDSYINAQTPLGNTSDLYSETGVGLKTNSAFTVDQLNTYTKLDPCLVGISNTVKMTYRAASTPSSAQMDLFNALDFSSADAIFKNEIPSNVKVRVAILDSGLDFTNSSLAAKVDSNYSKYFDFLGSITGVEFSKGNQDVFGTGTQLASLIAGDKDRSLAGLAENNVVLLPIKIRNTIGQAIGGYDYLNMIKLAVNMRSDVINLATSDVYKDGCTPIIGHAMLQAVRRGAFIVLSAGDNIEIDPSKPKRPGSFLTVKDNGPLFKGITVVPGCWGRYLKGVVTVGAAKTDGSALTSFSNWGADAVEIAAPGLALRSVNYDKSVVTSDSIVLPTALVTSAAAMTIAYHKAKTWTYDPWLIEDLMMNALPTKPGLDGLIRKGKFLNFGSLARYLKSLETQTSAQRWAQSTDNAELNGGWNPEAANDQRLMKIDVYAKLPMLQAGTRLQLNTVAYYQDAVIKVITESGTTYTSSNTNIADVNSQGILTAKAPGAVTITAKYQNQVATTLVSVVSYDVIDGPRSEITDLELSHSFNPAQAICPVSMGGATNSIYVKAFATYGDRSRSDVTSLMSLVAPGPNEIGAIIGGNYLSGWNWYGGKTYTVYGLYKGKRAQLDLVAPKSSYQSLFLKCGNSEIKNGETCEFSQEKVLILTSMMRVNANCLNYPVRGDNGLIPWSEALSSPDPTLNAMLKSGGRINNYQLQLGKTYTINADFGTYRGQGYEEVLPKQTFYLKIKPMVIKDLKFQTLGSNDPKDFPLGYSESSVALINDSGEMIAAPSEQFSIDFKEQGTLRKLKAPEAIAYRAAADLTTFNLWLFPKDGYRADVEMNVTHLPTGFQKTFALSSAALTEYNGPELSALPFQWNNFSMRPSTADCAQGENTPLKGTGTSAQPYTICSTKQFVDTGMMSSGSATAPAVVLGRSLDFASVLFPEKTLIFSAIDGGGKTLSNISEASADRDIIVLGATKISNVEFKSFSLSGRSAMLVAAENLENVRFADGMVLGNDLTANLSGLGASTNGQILLKTAKNIRVENVELQGVYSISPLGTWGNVTVENFGALNLKIRGSSVPGRTIFVGGIFSDCTGCSIVSSETSGTISQVDSLVGGISGSFSGKLSAVTSRMNIAARADKVGGLVGQLNGSPFLKPETPATKNTVIMNSSFLGSVRGDKQVGGIAGLSTGSIYKSVTLSPESIIQGVSSVGGVAGESNLFNEFYGINMNGTLSATGKFHQVANPVHNPTLFRPADRYLNVMVKGNKVSPDPAVIPSDRAPLAPITTLPAP